MYAKYYKLRYIFLKIKLHLVKVRAFLLGTTSKITLFSLSGFKDEKFIKEQTYAKTEPRKLYSGVF